MTLGEVLALVFVGALLAEAMLLAFWFPSYYRYGIPAFRQVVALSADQMDVIPEPVLEASFDGGLAFPRLVFKRMSEREVAFQEGAAAFRVWGYIPIMRGLISYEPERGRMVVTGILLWYPLVGLGAVLIALLPSGALPAALAAGAILMASFIVWAVQRTRFLAVATTLGEIVRGAP